MRRKKAVGSAWVIGKDDLGERGRRKREKDIPQYLRRLLRHDPQSHSDTSILALGTRLCWSWQRMRCWRCARVRDRVVVGLL